VGDPAGSNATAGLALRVTGTHKPLHHAKVEIPSGGRIMSMKNSCDTIGNQTRDLPACGKYEMT